ncbi:hypothetical protein HDV00_006735 [Rhizophlyctis rosea]|nr:hypothetical protein HDV00_006735 [Rhizophlyctis rosea]
MQGRTQAQQTRQIAPESYETDPNPVRIYQPSPTYNHTSRPNPTSTQVKVVSVAPVALPTPTPLSKIDKVKSLETIAAVVQSPKLMEASQVGLTTEEVLGMDFKQLQSEYDVTTEQYVALKRYKLQLQEQGAI